MMITSSACIKTRARVTPCGPAMFVTHDPERTHLALEARTACLHDLKRRGQ